jgi:hypothetical protein
MTDHLHAQRREKYRKRLVWMYSVTLVGVFILLAAALWPDRLGSIREIGILMTAGGGVAQIWATLVYARQR